MSTTAEERRLERLEEWRVRAESAATRTLVRVEAIATTLNAVAGDVAELVEHASEERGARRQRRRSRALAYSAATLLFLAAGALAGRGL